MAENPLKYSDIVIPDDAITKLIAQLEELNKALKEISAEATKVEGSLKGVSGTTEQNRNAIKGAATEADRLAKANRDLSSAWSENTRALAVLNNAKNEALKMTKLEVQAASAQEGSLNKLKALYAINSAEINKHSEAWAKDTLRGQELTIKNRQLEESIVRITKANKEQATLSNAVIQAQKQLAAATSKETQTIARLNLEKQKATQVTKLESIIAIEASGSYNQLAAQYDLNIIKLNAMSQEERENVAVGGMLEKQTAAISQQMVKMSAVTGTHSSMIGKAKGQYNGLNVSIAQIGRELPSLKYGMDMFFLAISNNLPMLADEIERVKLANAAAAKAGQATVPVWKQVAKALVGWQTIMVIGITLLTLYGEKIITWVGTMLKGKEVTTAATMATKAFNDVLGEESGGIRGVIAEQTKLGIMLKQSKQGMNDGSSAVKLYNDTLGIHYGKVTDVNDAWMGWVIHSKSFITATLNQMAAMKLLDTVSGKVAENMQARINNSSNANSEELNKQYLKTVEIAKKTGSTAKEGLQLFAKYMESPGTTFKETSGYANDLYNSFSRLYNMKGGKSFVENAVTIAKNNAEIDKATKGTEILIGATGELNETTKESTALLDLQRMARQAEIDAMEEGYEKEKAIIANDFKIKIEDTKAKLTTEEGMTKDGMSAINRTVASLLIQRNNALKKLSEENQKTIREALEKNLDYVREYRDKELDLTDEGKKKEQLIIQNAYDDEVQMINKTLRDEEDLNDVGKKALADSLTLAKEELDAKLAALDIVFKEKELQRDREYLQLKLDSTEAGSIEESNLRIELLENARQTELLKNSQLTSDMRQSEADINAAYDKLKIDAFDKLFNEINLTNYDQMRALAESQFALTDHSEKEKYQLKLLWDKKYWELVLRSGTLNGKKLTDIQIQTINNTIAGINAELSGAKKGGYEDIWDVLGISFNNPETQKAVEQAVSVTIDSINKIMDARARAAQAAVEAANTEVDAARKRVDAEIEARNLGYANSVDTAQKELAQAERNQDRALARQRKVQRQQQAIDALMQVSSMVTGTANIFRDVHPIYLAIGMVAVMWGTFLAAQAKAQQLGKKSSSYGEGGYEFLEGGSHASGKDIPIGMTKEGKERKAEGGEFMAIIRKDKTRKYKNRLPDIVNSLNKGIFDERYGGSMKNNLVYSVNTANDMTTLEKEVRAIREQGERKTYYINGVKIVKYKNLTTTYRQ